MQGKIWFEPVQTKEDKEVEKRTNGRFKPYSKILIKQHNNNSPTREVGHIITPGGTGQTGLNTIQICGFTEAFDYWGCGIYPGYKDIQCLFDEGIMGGKDHDADLKECLGCYRKPCQCDNQLEEGHENPFNCKRADDLKKRIIEREE